MCKVLTSAKIAANLLDENEFVDSETDLCRKAHKTGFASIKRAVETHEFS